MLYQKETLKVNIFVNKIRRDYLSSFPYKYNPATNANRAVILIVVRGLGDDIKTIIIGARKDENITIVTLYCFSKKEYNFAKGGY